MLAKIEVCAFFRSYCFLSMYRDCRWLTCRSIDGLGERVLGGERAWKFGRAGGLFCNMSSEPFVLC